MSWSFEYELENMIFTGTTRLMKSLIWKVSIEITSVLVLLSPLTEEKIETKNSSSSEWCWIEIQYLHINNLVIAPLDIPICPHRPQNSEWPDRLSLAGPEMVSILASPGRDNIRKIFLKINVFQSAGRQVSQVSGEKIGFSSWQFLNFNQSGKARPGGG